MKIQRFKRNELLDLASYDLILLDKDYTNIYNYFDVISTNIKDTDSLEEMGTKIRENSSKFSKVLAIMTDKTLLKNRIQSIYIPAMFLFGAVAAQVIIFFASLMNGLYMKPHLMTIFGTLLFLYVNGAKYYVNKLKLNDCVAILNEKTYWFGYNTYNYYYLAKKD